MGVLAELTRGLTVRDLETVWFFTLALVTEHEVTPVAVATVDTYDLIVFGFRRLVIWELRTGYVTNIFPLTPYY